ncbi:hypothetical protein MTR_2g036700 [Medicago truncatula]|uniref:Uncharacterized protein n=1 Tax=Medicago truncatula TaxID=3880 RepID=G7IN07_MEDTR|nr:hypothetical protein MTR_2g036700 [Medicago truncatula]
MRKMIECNEICGTTIVLPLKLNKFKPAKQQLSSIHPEVLLFLSKQHVLGRIIYICYHIKFPRIRGIITYRMRSIP